MLVRVYEFWRKVRKAWDLKIIINFSIFVEIGGVYVNLGLCYGIKSI
jgi:hypothetical protein